jgi:hypothetical protein
MTAPSDDYCGINVVPADKLVTVRIEPATAQRLMDWNVLHITDEGWTIDLDIWAKRPADVVPADDDLVYALEEALELLSDAQMLFAHGVGAMTDNGDRDNQERNIREAGELNLRISNFIAALRTAAPRPALNPIGEEGAREP